ncbi:MAG: HAD family hydrolase [Rhodospirillaceae bacterium]|nr:HAD family hydrolase [Rhodospirillaceae bacterium]|tara:strand:+ start:1463 stop:2122 length:660 start_codon:yes stop_codon:yes gene_type:complete
MNPKAVIFDWDITLVDSVKAIHGSLKQTFIEFGNPSQAWSIDDVLEWLRKSMRVSFKDLFGDQAKEAADYFYIQYRNNHLKKVNLMPNALETLKFLKGCNVKLFVVSSKKGELVRAEASTLKIQNYFSRIVGSSDAIEDKPAKGSMDFAIEKHNITLQNDVWYVGDCGIDVVCARNSGCYSIIIGKAPALVGETIHKPDKFFSNHKAFQDFIKTKVNTI